MFSRYRQYSCACSPHFPLNPRFLVVVNVGLACFVLYLACPALSFSHDNFLRYGSKCTSTRKIGQVLEQAGHLVRVELQRDPNTLFLVGTYSIGKERVLEAVAKATGSR